MYSYRAESYDSKPVTSSLNHQGDAEPYPSHPQDVYLLRFRLADTKNLAQL